jgi:transmembrane sensor
MAKSADKIRLEDLAHKYLMGTLSKEEQQEFDHWFNTTNEEPIAVPDVLAEDKEAHRLAILKKIRKELDAEAPRKITLWRNIAAAAAVVFVVGLTALFYLKYQQRPEPIDTNSLASDIAPGKNAATLTLADGKKIVLSGLKDGRLLAQAGVEIEKRADGQLIYKQKDAGTTVKPDYNTLTTSRGEQYQVFLPDGSRVWLNAASSVKFPLSFGALKERKVYLTGEAYFEVSKDKSRPFRVVSEQQVVTVYGTHFNINSYGDEATVKTTLLEGSVDVNGTLLKPNQQAVLAGGKINVIPVRVENVVAWKNGYFRFSAESLESIMRKVSRWYDVEVEFQNPSLKDVEFGGVVTRYTTISKVLEMLQLTEEASFELKGKTIIVKNKK